MTGLSPTSTKDGDPEKSDPDLDPQELKTMVLASRVQRVAILTLPKNLHLYRIEMKARKNQKDTGHAVATEFGIKHVYDIHGKSDLSLSGSKLIHHFTSILLSF